MPVVVAVGALWVAYAVYLAAEEFKAKQQQGADEEDPAADDVVMHSTNGRGHDDEAFSRI
jgi:hypothetical protein